MVHSPSAGFYSLDNCDIVGSEVSGWVVGVWETHCSRNWTLNRLILGEQSLHLVNGQLLLYYIIALLQAHA